MKTLFVLYILATYSLSYSQDSTIVYQRQSMMFSNKYVFFDDGRFKHFFTTDDGQIWYGKGIYIDHGNKRQLHFQSADSSYITPFIIHYEVNFKRTLKIQGNRFKSEDYYHTTRNKWVIFEERE